MKIETVCREDMADIEYEGEELYEKEKEDLFKMDRFDPEDEAGQDAAAKETLLDDINKKLKKKRKIEDTKENEPVEVKEQPEKKKRKRSKKKRKAGQEAEGFTVLGDPTDSQKKKVARVLPQWLANPDILQVCCTLHCILLTAHCSLHTPHCTHCTALSKV